jgi:hypothetical protein
VEKKKLGKITLKSMEGELKMLTEFENRATTGGDDVFDLADGWKLVNTSGDYYYIDPNGEVHLPEAVVYGYIIHN